MLLSLILKNGYTFAGEQYLTSTFFIVGLFIVGGVCIAYAAKKNKH